MAGATSGLLASAGARTVSGQSQDAAVGRRGLIAYRGLSMKADEILDRASAERYAGWFKALADPTRIQIVALLAHVRRPMTVGEIVDAVHVVQSTVSHHLRILSEARFVLAERLGTSNRYRINEACVRGFPTAADVVMGKPVPGPCAG